MIFQAKPKSLNVDAVRWQGDNIDEVFNFTKGLINMNARLWGEDILELYDVEDSQYFDVHVGDYIVKEPNGYCHRVASDLFSHTYQIVGPFE